MTQCVECTEYLEMWGGEEYLYEGYICEYCTGWVCPSCRDIVDDDEFDECCPSCYKSMKKNNS
ncbi:hypothetical protein BKP45_04940 [Anaerobacillus alkalidiazotrophicus]|uniref:Uncharacterized protein n=1 Tax=Anaerobacillus alkalidiazotrophicus TaxID=472963 RepID=A0A1S2MBR2_9BACI|nr:hypothetical protein [Anaerobacillus alkalidiazotrophicus]OIJ22026.1 hypothetical protein BKP45_04940 [Anaerobacillus alkalidiazotrophicus]